MDSRTLDYSGKFILSHENHPGLLLFQLFRSLKRETGTETGSWRRCFTPRRSGAPQRSWPRSRRSGRRRHNSSFLLSGPGNSPAEEEHDRAEAESDCHPHRCAVEAVCVCVCSHFLTSQHCLTHVLQVIRIYFYHTSIVEANRCSM